MLRLEEGELLNDNLIVFYLRYLQVQLEKENKALADRIYFMNPWFYQKLTHGKGRSINYDAVKSWTAKVDLLSHDYVVVPINEHMHWYLAIICHPSKLISSEEVEEIPAKDTAQDPKQPAEGDQMDLDGPSTPREASQATDEDDVQIVSDLRPGLRPNTSRTASSKGQPGRKAKGTRQVDPTEPRVITLDSLGGPHSRTCINLRDYLVQEIKHRRDIDIEPPTPFGMTAKGIPEQDDFSSCGVYLLAYMERFLRDPDQVVRDITAKVHLGWNINTSALRGEIRELIIKLRLEQNNRMKEEKKAKAEKLKAKRQAKNQNALSQNTASADMPATTQIISGTSDPSPGPKGGKASPSDCLSSGSPHGSKSPALVPAPEGQAGDIRQPTATEAIKPVRSPPCQAKLSPRHSTEQHFLSPMRDSSEDCEDKRPTSAPSRADETRESPRRESSQTIEESGSTQEAPGREAHDQPSPLHRGDRAREEAVQSTSRASTPPRKTVSTTDAIAIDDSPESTIVKANRNAPIRSPYFHTTATAAATNASRSLRARKGYEERAKDDDQLAMESAKDATVNSHEYGGTGNRPAGVRLEPIVVED
ncbi:hypothetical protein ACRALDRAFT_2031649 [Sodiomyces alcalophilus JCM 7366]|uniref:uncharacterized protein n=1 Tax=Sodiomyces alcalophilus JCM 7366 TaxID=591952 RepID=UPI0039B60AF4